MNGSHGALANVSAIETDIAAGRLDEAAYVANFSDLHPPLAPHDVQVAADRCYFCYDAPCQRACPTNIDVALFIRQISHGNDLGAAKTILSQNIMGGMCARVCPTETLCEQACVRMASEGQAVQIGRLQRHATDALLNAGHQPFAQGASTGKRIAVVGAGPAGLACAHKLAELGHQVTLFEARAKPGGLNEYGIAAYKTVNDFARREVDFILGIGGIDLKLGVAFGKDASIASLRDDYDAVFIGLGLGGFNQLGLADPTPWRGLGDAADFIARLRQSRDLAQLPVGRRIVVVGGGMTAIDIAVQSRRLGAEQVTIVYRRGAEHMKASPLERALALKEGVVIHHWLSPAKVLGRNGNVTGLRLARVKTDGPRLIETGETLDLAADMIFAAIGQNLLAHTLVEAGLQLKQGRIFIDDERRTSLKGVWAGGDCVFGGEDLTVSAVEDGKQAALSMDRALRGSSRGKINHG